MLGTTFAESGLETIGNTCAKYVLATFTNIFADRSLFGVHQFMSETLVPIPDRHKFPHEVPRAPFQMPKLTVHD
jgi:hypothetical protein